jgi:hypothetical protein
MRSNRKSNRQNMTPPTHWPFPTWNGIKITPPPTKPVAPFNPAHLPDALF